MKVANWDKEDLPYRIVSRRAFVCLTGAGVMAAASAKAMPRSAFADAGSSEPSSGVSPDASPESSSAVADDRTADGQADGQPSNESGSAGVEDSDGGSTYVARRYGTDYKNYPLFEGKEIDAHGFIILTSAAFGRRLETGKSYRVTQSELKLTPEPTDYVAGLVTDCNLIHIDEGCKLVVRGSQGANEKPGLPGIAVPESASLCLVGDGTVEAYGGHAGGGSRGQDAYSPYRIGGTICSGKGGEGGRGGGGAGAAIGVEGSYGGAGGLGAMQSSGSCTSRKGREEHGQKGIDGHKAGTPPVSGHLFIAKNLTVNGHYGDERPGGFPAPGGKQGQFLKVSSGILTKHLTGGSGGGGGGGGGGRANAFGSGGVGGNGGGGGGSGATLWLPRHATSSDAPPQGAGGTGGNGGNKSNDVGAKGEGTQTSRGTWHVFHGGEGGGQEAGSTPPLAKNKLWMCYRKTQNPKISVNLPTWEDKVPDVCQGNAASLAANVPNSSAWYVQNELFNTDGKGTESKKIATLAGYSTLQEVKEMLTSDLPASKMGAKFLGWALMLDGNKTKKVYDAATGAFYEDVFKEEHKVGETSATEGVWMCPVASNFTALWGEGATYSIEYCANGGSFTDLSGNPVEGDTKISTGLEKGKGVTLWDNGSIGEYHLVAPKDMPAGSPLLGWTKKVDPSTHMPTRTMYPLGKPIYSLNPEGLDTVKLYAVWKRGNDIVEEE